MAYGYNQYGGYNPSMYGMQQQYQQRLNQMEQAQLPRCEIIHVNGENGARAFRMAPNSTVLLMDDTAPVVWLVQSDGAGYHTQTPFKIEEYKSEVPIDVRTLEDRIARLEAMINEQSDAQAPKQKRSAKPSTDADA